MQEISFEGEEWREIKGVFVSNHGRIRERNSDKPFFPKKTESGYRRTQIDGKSHRVFHLVGAAFLSSRPSPEHTLDHIDRNKLNDSASNLRWATKKEQNENRGSFRRSQNSILIEMNMGDGWRPYWIRDLVSEFGMSSVCINHCLRGRNKSHKGAIFRYRDEDLLPGEIWKTAFEHPVSNLGRVRCMSSNTKNHAYFPQPRSLGYSFAFGYSVHRLVAEAFLPPAPSSAHTIDHIDRNRSNNNAANLRWLTVKEQASNKTDTPHRAQVRWRAVEGIDSNGAAHRFASVAQAARACQVLPQGIQKSIRKQTKAGGMTWKRLTSASPQ